MKLHLQIAFSQLILLLFQLQKLHPLQNAPTGYWNAFYEPGSGDEAGGNYKWYATDKKVTNEIIELSKQVRKDSM